ncbi:F10A5.9 [Melia azedarach]|uniref:F10A5.9 n=1 Tax=Melia azedarach TaxID=155640 RepID=A0ACC1WUL1_MELAZ|nr:F10A5.9 [Melia azedarach]
MIAVHFPEGIWQTSQERERITMSIYRPQRESFVIQVRPAGSDNFHHQFPQNSFVSYNKLNFSAMKLFNRFRKILMRLMFSFPSRGSANTSSASRHKTCDRYDPPKTSCSSYYSSHSHYSEAIADCIEFFNKSSQEGILDGRNSDVLV